MFLIYLIRVWTFFADLSKISRKYHDYTMFLNIRNVVINFCFSYQITVIEILQVPPKMQISRLQNGEKSKTSMSFLSINISVIIEIVNCHYCFSTKSSTRENSNRCRRVLSSAKLACAEKPWVQVLSEAFMVWI